MMMVDYNPFFPNGEKTIFQGALSARALLVAVSNSFSSLAY